MSWSAGLATGSVLFTVSALELSTNLRKESQYLEVWSAKIFKGAHQLWSLGTDKHHNILLKHLFSVSHTAFDRFLIVKALVGSFNK